MNIAQAAQVCLITMFCSMTITENFTMSSPRRVQTGIVIPDDLRHAEQFIRTLEAGGLVVQSLAHSHLEASFGGQQKAAFITTDQGVVEIIVMPGPMDAEQLNITYTKWNGNGHHYRIEGPSVRKPEDVYGRFAYFTLHRNWFITTQEAELTESSNASWDNPRASAARAGWADWSGAGDKSRSVY